MRKIVILLAILTVLTAPATSLQGKVFPVDRVANEYEDGQFVVQITNNESEPVSVRVKTQGQCSTCLYVPDSYIQLQPNTSKNTTINLYGSQDIPVGRYGFKIFISEIGTSRNIQLSEYYRINRSRSLIFSSFNNDKEVYMPGEQVKTSFQIRNIGGRTISDYYINATFLNQSKNIEGLEVINEAERKYDVTFEVSDRKKPGTEIIDLSAYQDGELDSNISRTVEIGSSERVEVGQESSNNLITSTRTLTVNNTGNVETVSEVKQSLPGYFTPFTNYETEPDNITSSKDQTFVKWNVATEPGTQKSVSYTVHYWIPLLILAGITSLLLLYKRFNREISFEKHVSKSGNGEITINIDISNNSGKSIEGLEIVDFVPNIADVDGTFEFARPSIRKKNDGTQLTWDLDTLAPGDQRILEYTIKPQVEVEGDVTLPEAELSRDDEQVQKTSKLNTQFSSE